MDRKTILILINAFISLAIMAALLQIVGVSEVLGRMAGMDLFLLILSLLSLLGMDLVMAYRISILLDGMKAGTGFMRILRSHFVGMLLADFTPSRAGYFATAATLRYNYGVPSEKALLSIFGPQIFDFAFKVVAGGLAILYLMIVFLGPGQGLVLMAGAVVIGAFIIVMLLVLFSKRFLGIFSFVRNLPLLSRLYDVLVRMQGSSHVVVRKTPHILALIMVSWVFRSLSWYFAAKSVGISLGTEFPEVLFYFFLQPLVTMLEFVPSPTIAGLGLSESGTTLVFSLFGIPLAQAATFALIVRFKSTLLHLPGVPDALRLPQGIGNGGSSSAGTEAA
ncbi:flippase-like domain-containing protein [Candidatus Micrarchaeota archaeon]|nr:flippase-like domain-containing protein [Candidatus Micrarchaeota archaeon]